ncbi:phage portal protein [Nesterenkonia sp.]|uniref:phage portal protein n=1 Tax=Nesterenkonia sp. TaxID=704201 RepID=UPI00260E38C6|nr:phage portal protein [Nesterenkonia sp.]
MTVTAWTTEDIRGLSLPEVTDDELSVIRTLFLTWQNRLEKNLKRSLYYDAEQAFKDLGIALPPQLQNAKFYLGWPAMAVRKLAQHSLFAGLRLPGTSDPLELNEVFERNRFGLEFSESVVSGYKHGVAFITVAAGGPGEPAVQIQAHQADSSAAVWDPRRRQISALLTISDMQDGKRPSDFTVWLPDNILEFTHDQSSGRWEVERLPHRMGRTMATPVCYDPQLGQPFGRSRISNPVMSLTDMAVRAYVRMEGNAEFYSSPQLAAEGADIDAFDGLSRDKKFQLAMDRIIALTRDEDGNAPSIKQLQQASMEPHSAMLRTVAMAFSGETGIPPSSLGIIHDNPASAEAIRASKHDLLIDATYQNTRVLNTAVQDIARMAWMVRENSTDLPEEAWQLSARFTDPEFRSLSARADAVVKIAGALPDLAGSEVLLEELFDEDQLDRIREERRRAEALSLLQQGDGTGEPTAGLPNAAPQPDGEPAEAAQ